MLCRGARRDWLVFGEFDPARHVGPVRWRPEFRTYRAIDFGYAEPFVCLWLQLSPAGEVSVTCSVPLSTGPAGCHSLGWL